MIKLNFITGGAIRRVFINGRKISLISAELGFTPIEIDLDKLDEEETKEKMSSMKLDNTDLYEISKLKTEEEIAMDIKKDFQKSGWRLVHRDGS